MTKELKVIQDFQDLSLYLMERIMTFPRNLRYGLGLAMEKRLQDLLALFIRAKYAPAGGKAPLLREVNVELEVLRFQLRQATVLKALATNSQLHALERMQQVGQQVGGWLKQTASSTPVKQP
jgi:hypothetical protein